ncbi:PD-(D/E)XK nuclease-like domain-containing protein [Spirillospora sp. CA-253888]
MTATAEAFQVTRPGVYESMPAETYHADPVPGGSLSSSEARRLLPPSCPALFRHYKDQPDSRTTTKALDFGQAAHALVLEGDESAVVKIDAEDYRTKAAQTQRNAAHAAGKVPLLPHELDRVRDMAAALKRHEVAAALLAKGQAEKSLFWADAETNVARRARLDWHRERTGTRRVIIPDYKGLALDTPIPTPTGWTTIRDLQVGDQVFDASGRPCTVTHKSDVHLRTCYRVTFDDGSSVVCDDEHLWITTSGRGGKRNRTSTAVVSTEQIRSTLKLYGQCHHRVQVAGALQLADAELPVHPYVYGCWLGDGSVGSGRISKPDDELFALIAKCGYTYSAPHGKTNKCPTRSVYGLQSQLRKAGLLGHRRIPDAYLRASASQRLDLLRGLMDTDGSWNQTRQQAVFTSTNKELALAVRELACSLGQRAILHSVTGRGFGLTVDAYRVTFTPTRGFVPFALSRKADAVQVRRDLKSRRRVIVSVEQVPTIPTQCIAVDSPDRTYLCTEAMIPTHNTAVSAEPGKWSRAAHEHGYHCQAAWYLDAIQALDLGGRDSAFVFIVQEKTPPYVVSVIELDNDALALGHALNRKAIHTYLTCTETGHWPGYSDDVVHVSLPPWAANALEDYS